MTKWIRAAYAKTQQRWLVSNCAIIYHGPWTSLNERIAGIFWHELVLKANSLRAISMFFFHSKNVVRCAATTKWANLYQQEICYFQWYLIWWWNILQYAFCTIFRRFSQRSSAQYRFLVSGSWLVPPNSLSANLLVAIFIFRMKKWICLYFPFGFMFIGIWFNVNWAFASMEIKTIHKSFSLMTKKKIFKKNLPIHRKLQKFFHRVLFTLLNKTLKSSFILLGSWLSNFALHKHIFFYECCTFHAFEIETSKQIHI